MTFVQSVEDNRNVPPKSLFSQRCVVVEALSVVVVVVEKLLLLFLRLQSFHSLTV